MRRRSVWILVASVAAVALGAATVGAVALLLRGGTPAALGGHRYLALRASGELPENPLVEMALIERHPPTLRVLVESLERAARDPKLEGVLLRVGGLEAGWGRVRELRSAVERFRRSGKPIYAHVELAGNREYYLASACSKIYALPTGLLDVTGLAAEVTFLRGTLDKLGVEADFVGVGRYKNAPNQFTETGFTEPHREQMESLVDSLFEEYVGAIADGRKLPPETVRQLVDAGPYDARRALEAGLVDELVYADELAQRLGGEDSVAPASYVEGGFALGGRTKVAVVYVLGDIVDGESGEGIGGGRFAGSRTVARALRQAREDGSIKAIVLRVDSPGGSGTAADAIWREVRLAAEAKPLVVSMGDTAASGGYYVATGAGTIVAEPTTITGSIGVFGGKFSLRGLYDKLGVSRAVVRRGERADMFSEYRAWTPAERARVESLMVSFYEDFLERVARARGKTRDEVHAVAQGRVWTGAQAREQGLVDELGGLERALELVREKAGLAPDAALTLVALPEPKGLLDALFEPPALESVLARGPSAREFERLLRWLALAERGLPLLRQPFDVEVR